MPFACGFTSKPANVPTVPTSNRRKTYNMKSFFCTIPASNVRLTQPEEVSVDVECAESADDSSCANEGVKMSFIEKLAAKCVANSKEIREKRLPKAPVPRQAACNVEISDSAIERIMISDASRKLNYEHECGDSRGSFVPPFFVDSWSAVDDSVFDDCVECDISII